MAYAEIDVNSLRIAVNAVLDHLIKDLELTKISIEETRDYYWHCPASEIYDMNKKPVGIDVGRLTDDVAFVKLINPGDGGDVSYNLIHVAPLLRYIAETIKK